MEYDFMMDERLGIETPVFQSEWDLIDHSTQEKILEKWEQIKGKIPDRIKDLEQEINDKLDRIGNEEDFEVTCQLNSEIAELASVINDLWIWYRTNQKVSPKVHP